MQFHIHGRFRSKCFLFTWKYFVRRQRLPNQWQLFSSIKIFFDYLKTFCSKTKITNWIIILFKFCEELFSIDTYIIHTNMHIQSGRDVFYNSFYKLRRNWWITLYISWLFSWKLIYLLDLIDGIDWWTWWMDLKLNNRLQLGNRSIIFEKLIGYEKLKKGNWWVKWRSSV